MDDDQPSANMNKQIQFKTTQQQQLTHHYHHHHHQHHHFHTIATNQLIESFLLISILFSSIKENLLKVVVVEKNLRRVVEARVGLVLDRTSWPRPTLGSRLKPNRNSYINTTTINTTTTTTTPSYCSLLNVLNNLLLDYCNIIEKISSKNCYTHLVDNLSFKNL